MIERRLRGATRPGGRCYRATVARFREICSSGTSDGIELIAFGGRQTSSRISRDGADSRGHQLESNGGNDKETFPTMLCRDDGIRANFHHCGGLLGFGSGYRSRWGAEVHVLGLCGVLEIARRPRGASRVEPAPTAMACQIEGLALCGWLQIFMGHKKARTRGGLFIQLVGETGFEPAAFSSRTRRATWLRYTPMEKILGKKNIIRQAPEQGRACRCGMPSPATTVRVP